MQRCIVCGNPLGTSIFCQCSLAKRVHSVKLSEPQPHDPEAPEFHFCIATKDNKIIRVFYSEEGGMYFVGSPNTRVFALTAKTFANVLAFLNYFLANQAVVNSRDVVFVIARSLNIKCEELRK